MAATARNKQDMVRVAIRDECAYDVIGTPPVLTRGEALEFTPAEAEGLLALVLDGRPACVRVEGSVTTGGDSGGADK